jgi:hypothetical protein
MTKTQDFKNLVLKYITVNGDKLYNATCLFFVKYGFPLVMCALAPFVCVG